MLNRLSFDQNRLLPLCAQLRAHALDHCVKLVVSNLSKRAFDHEFLRQRAGNQAGELNRVTRAQYLDDRSPVLFPLTLKVSEEAGLLQTPAGRPTYAISSVVAKRPAGVRRTVSTMRASLFGTAFQASVSTAPAVRILTRMLRGASSTARWRASASSAPLDEPTSE
jgi:hypothetical protein